MPCRPFCSFVILGKSLISDSFLIFKIQDVIIYLHERILWKIKLYNALKALSMVLNIALPRF